MYWWSRGPLSDVRRILDEFYTLTAEDSLVRGWCSLTTALLAGVQNDAAVAQAAVDESLRIGRLHQRAALIAWASAVTFLSTFAVQVQPEKSAKELLGFAESLISRGPVQARWPGNAVGLSHACKIHLSQGELKAAAEAGEAALELCRRHGDLFPRGFILNDLSEIRWRQGDRDHAEALARGAPPDSMRSAAREH